MRASVRRVGALSYTYYIRNGVARWRALRSGALQENGENAQIGESDSAEKQK